jgi:hypothetical protein
MLDVQERLGPSYSFALRYGYALRLPRIPGPALRCPWPCAVVACVRFAPLESWTSLWTIWERIPLHRVSTSTSFDATRVYSIAWPHYNTLQSTPFDRTHTHEASRLGERYYHAWHAAGAEVMTIQDAVRALAT